MSEYCFQVYEFFIKTSKEKIELFTVWNIKPIPAFRSFFPASLLLTIDDRLTDTQK